MSPAKMKIWSVYVMAAPDKSGTTYFKVGVTSDIAKRICSVQTGCPLFIKRVWVITLWGNGSAQSLEWKMHRQLAPHHSHGEWFSMRTDNLGHKRAMNDAFETGVRHASQMGPVKWRSMDVPALKAAVREHAAEMAQGRRATLSAQRAKALVKMVTQKRAIL